MYNVTYTFGNCPSSSPVPLDEESFWSSDLILYFKLKTSGACFFSAPIRPNQTTNTLILDSSARFLFFFLIAKHLDENHEIFPGLEVSISSPDIPDTDQTGSVSGSFYVLVYCYFVIISFIHWCIYHFTNYQHRDKINLFPTRPVSWIPDQTIPQIKQNTAPRPEFYGVARSGSGIPDSQGCPAGLYFKFVIPLPVLDS